MHFFCLGLECVCMGVMGFLGESLGWDACLCVSPGRKSLDWARCHLSVGSTPWYIYWTWDQSQLGGHSRKRESGILLASNTQVGLRMHVYSVISYSLQPHGLLPSGSSVHGIFQVRIVEQVAISSSKESSWPRVWTCVCYISRWILYYCTTLEAQGLGVDRWKLESVCGTIQQQGRPECSAPSCPSKGSFPSLRCHLRSSQLVVQSLSAQIFYLSGSLFFLTSYFYLPPLHNFIVILLLLPRPSGWSGKCEWAPYPMPVGNTTIFV